MPNECPSFFPAEAETSVIFVLAGHKQRKVFALDLFRRGLAPVIVMGTGKPVFLANLVLEKLGAAMTLTPVGRANLEAWASSPEPVAGQFLAMFDGEDYAITTVPVARFGTLEEVAAFGAWLSSHPEVSSVNVVSYAMHLPRVKLCCRYLLPGRIRVRFTPVPLSYPAEPMRRIPEGVKLAVYSVILPFRKVE